MAIYKTNYVAISKAIYMAIYKAIYNMAIYKQISIVIYIICLSFKQYGYLCGFRYGYSYNYLYSMGTFKAIYTTTYLGYLHWSSI